MSSTTHCVYQTNDSDMPAVLRVIL